MEAKLYLQIGTGEKILISKMYMGESLRPAVEKLIQVPNSIKSQNEVSYYS